jgi:two-component system sensor histidine kinase UhpB
VALFVATRVGAAVSAMFLLLVPSVSGHDRTLIAVGLAYGGVSAALVWWSSAARRPAFWAVDVLAGLLLILASGQWRSPFYLLAITALILPGTGLRFTGAVVLAVTFTAAYLGIASMTGVNGSALESPARLETLATHLLVPVLVVLAVAYAAQLLRRLERERFVSERLAVETERRRIAWELHDSSKQRIHAASLVLSNLPERLADREASAVRQALAELTGATTDMEASLSELRAPIPKWPLADMLRNRALELGHATSAAIEVTGEAPPLPGWIAAHAYRIAAEALTNAVRHAEASRIDVQIGRVRNRVMVRVADDGKGIPADPGPTGTGFESMRARASAIRADLTIRTVPGGTHVELIVPSTPYIGDLS